MGLWDRIQRVTRANLNHWVGKAEDPEKILEQTVAQMQDNLVELRQAVAQAIATQKRVERQSAQALATADEWYRRAQIALQQGNEELARDALARRKSYQDTSAAMTAQLNQMSEIVAKQKQNMQALETKILEAKTKKDLYIARARSAQASEKLYEMLGSPGANSTIGAFERMEEKVLELEARSEVVAGLGTDDLEKRFEALGKADDINAELAAMKAQLAGHAPAQLPASQAVAELQPIPEQSHENA